MSSHKHSISNSVKENEVSRYNMNLNDKGQCFNCLIKPLVYKRPIFHYFCHRCDREYDKNGNFQPNWAWEDEYLPTGRFPEKRKIELEMRERQGV